MLGGGRMQQELRHKGGTELGEGMSEQAERLGTTSSLSGQCMLSCGQGTLHTFPSFFFFF